MLCKFTASKSIFVLVIFFVCIKCETDFFLAYKYDTDEYYCLTNSSFALSGINEEEGEVINDNKTTSLQIQSKEWMKDSKLSESAIFDRRWERMPTIKTEYVDNEDPLKFYISANISQTNFAIFLSIRIEKEAHIFLCDAPNPNSANCYWFIMQGFGGKKSVLRKCPAGTIPTRNWKHSNCSEISNVSHPDNYPQFLTKDKWSHFKLSKNNERFIMSQINKETPIMIAEDRNEMFAITHLVLHSKLSSGFWKVHSIQYISSYKEIENNKLGIPKLTDGSVCLSLFIKTCTLCTLTLSLGDTSRMKVLYREHYTAKNWKEITFAIDYISTNSIALYVSTNINGTTTETPFWFIDKNIEVCSKRGYHIIRSNQKFQCQLISDERDTFLTLDNIISNDAAENSCGTQTVSKHCIPCSLFSYRTCGKMKICANHSNKIDCYCSDGWSSGSTADNCTYSVSSNDREIGSNGKNRNPYKYNVNDNSIFFNWNYQLQPSETVLVEYQHKSYLGCNGSNSNLDKQEKEISDTSFEVADLIPFSKYFFTIWIKKDDERRNGINLTVKTQNKSIVTDEEVPKVTVENVKPRSASIQFSSIKCSKIRGPLNITFYVTCDSSWCKNSTYQQNNPFIGHQVINGLLPFTNYSITAEVCRQENNCHQKVQTLQFQTMPQNPNTVENLTVYSKDDDSISIKWKPPYPPTGILEFYQVGYYMDSETNKKTENVSDSPCMLWPKFQCFTITNLTRNKTYNVQMTAKNKMIDIFGQVKEVQATTIIEPPGKPHKLHNNWTVDNDLNIFWKHPYISNGKIKLFNILVTTYEIHVFNISISVVEDMANYNYTLNSSYLQPTTYYKIEVWAFNSYFGEESMVDDISPPSIPMFEQNAIIVPTNNTIIFTVPQIITRSSGGSYHLYCLLLEKSSIFNVQELDVELQQFQNRSNTDLSQFKILWKCRITNSTVLNFTIGKAEEYIDNCVDKFNPLLEKETSYNISILLVHTYSDKKSYKLYSYTTRTLGEPQTTSTQTTDDSPKTETNDLSLLFLLVLLLIPIAIIIYIKRDAVLTKCYISRSNNRWSTNSPASVVEEQTSLTSFSIDKDFKVYSKKIKVSDFEQYLKESIANGELERQHSLFPKGATRSWKRGALKENKNKNRYTNLMAYDHTRVILTKIDGNEYSDYINANYIDGYEVPKAYIATQGPKMSTSYDFWRMIWQENVAHIVILANVFEGGKKKVDKYWPDERQELTFKDITIQNVRTKVMAEYIHRVFNVQRENKSRNIHQYHFSSWPDHGVPLYPQSLVQFVNIIQSLSLDCKSPIVVHCSAGVGRTGTILLCDICLRMAAKEQAVDALKVLQKLRNQRPNMVDNQQQYKLAHLVVLECLKGYQTAIPCSEIKTEVNKLLQNNKIKEQMEYLENVAWQDQVMKNVVTKSQAFVVIEEKNRFQDILPENQGCVILPRYPVNDDASTYINAVKVDGFRNENQFIVTQQPMPNTLGDFWRLVDKSDALLIVSLNDIDPNEESSCVFWPNETTPELNPVDFISVQYASTLPSEFYDLTIVKLQNTAKQDTKQIKVMSMKGWNAKTPCPKIVEDFLSFWEDTHGWFKESEHVIVTCFDGALATGLYLAMSFVIEKMKLEQVCDVCQAVRSIRHNRTQFVRSSEQFKFLYRAAVMYLNQFQCYSNFD